VSDTGGIDDKGFNQNAFKGLTDAQAELGVNEPKFLESTEATAYTTNIQTFIDQGCDLIVTVGFLLGDATGAAADANPEQKFAIVDFAYDPAKDNVLGIVFTMDEPSFLAGYLAAGMSKSGKVGTFGGIQIPPVEVFMDGFYGGVQYYNQQKGKSVEVLGWDPATKTGSFTGDFSDTAKGAAQAEAFIQEGADIVFPVAGPVGLGAAAAVSDANAGGAEVMFIGVDVDQFESAPETQDIILTSVLKRIDNGVKGAVQAALDGTFAGGVAVNDFKNEGTGLAPYHNFDAAVPAELKTEIEDLQQQITDGTLKPVDFYRPA
jgi:basic membrane protein A